MEQIQNTPEQAGQAKKSMILSIVGLVLSSSGIPGLIVSLIARKNCKQAANDGVTGGQLKVANILSKIGVPVSIVTTVLYVISFIASLAAQLS